MRELEFRTNSCRPSTFTISQPTKVMHIYICVFIEFQQQSFSFVRVRLVLHVKWPFIENGPLLFSHRPLGRRCVGSHRKICGQCCNSAVSKRNETKRKKYNTPSQFCVLSSKYSICKTCMDVPK